MKTKRFFIATLLVVAAVAAAVVSCKKEKTNVTYENSDKEVAALINRINEFQELRDAIHFGNRNGGTMTVEEMRQILDLTSNYEHSQHMTYCQNTILDTLRIAMPTIDDNGNVSETDVVSTYDAFETALQQRMESISDDRIIPSFFSIMMPQTETKCNDIEIVFTRGQKGEFPSDRFRSPTVDGPFEDICLTWGLNGGHCNPTPGINITWDAADELSTCFVSNLTPPGPGYTLVTANLERVTYIATDDVVGNWVYWIPSTIVSPCENWLFYQYGIVSNEPCLCEDDLNCEWSNITNNFVLQTGQKYYSPTLHSPFFYCTVHDEWRLCDNNGCKAVCYRFHTLEVVYALFYWMPVE
jgi:hypothetical protein